MWESEHSAGTAAEFKFPERIQTPKPYQDPHPPVWQAAASDRARSARGARARLAVTVAVAARREDGRDDRHVPDGSGLGPTRGPADEGARTTGSAVYTLVHVYDDPDEAAAYGLWESVNWWYRNLAEFHLKWELAHLSDEAKQQAFPSLQANRG